MRVRGDTGDSGANRRVAKMCLKLFCVLGLLVGAAVAKVANHRACEDLPQDSCSVSEVRVTPCADPRSCRLKKGSPASISFDFTPNFSASKLKTGLFWASPGGEVPFSELKDADGCAFTSCPVASGASQQLNYSLRLGKKLPSGTYEFKWKLWDESNTSNICCFKTTIQMR